MNGICIYSGDNKLCEYLQRYVEEIANFLSQNISISSYTSPEQLLSSIANTNYSVYILDADSHEDDFYKLAKKIRNQDSDCHIVLTSETVAPAVFGYCINACDYLLKPVQEESIKQAISKIFKNHFHYAVKTVKVKISGIWVSINTDDLVMVESVGHDLLFTLSDGNSIKMNGSLDDYASLLNTSRDFLRCHKSYMVNLRFVTKLYANVFILHNAEEVNISRQYLQICKSYYLNYKAGLHA